LVFNKNNFDQTSKVNINDNKKKDNHVNNDNINNNYTSEYRNITNITNDIDQLNNINKSKKESLRYFEGSLKCRVKVVKQHLISQIKMTKFSIKFDEYL
jgi:hypothetical protein